MSASERRAAAALRRQAAEQHGERGGDAAFRAYRSAVPGIGAARRVPTKTQIRAKPEKRNGIDMVHTFGYFTVYNRSYPMWDVFGEYAERVRTGSGARSLASDPDVAFLINHAGVTMARTATNGTRQPTLELREEDTGAWHDAWVNPKRRDVADMLIAMDDGNIDQMSYAFMIPEGKGLWSEDWTEFEIIEWDIDRGDVSAVNYGANPYTDIAARTAEVLNDIDHLPQGALRAAAERLQRRGEAPTSARRERIEVAGRSASGSDLAARLRARIDRTADRYRRFFAGEQTERTVSTIQNVKLPWFAIRNADGEEYDDARDGKAAQGDSATATIFIYDEIGGSFGTNAKSFAMALEEITAPNITLRINSPGGSVFDALAIHSSLLHHPARVTSYIDGYAASAASVIAMAGDEVVMMPGTQMMIHCASATTDGDDMDHDRMVTFLRRQSENIADLYARRAGGDPAEWMDLMRAETWAIGKEAVDLGLADRVETRHDRTPATGDRDLDERMARTHDITRYGYRYAGRGAAPDPMQRRIARRIEASSLGTPDALAMRERTDPDVARAIVERSKNITATPEQPRGRSIALIEAQLAAEK